MQKTALTLFAGAMLAGLAFSGTALAQNYPTKPITVVVPFSAGGPTDTVTRLVAESMSKDLGQQVVVENVGGAGGTLGAGRVAQESEGHPVGGQPDPGGDAGIEVADLGAQDRSPKGGYARRQRIGGGGLRRGRLVLSHSSSCASMQPGQ